MRSKAGCAEIQELTIQPAKPIAPALSLKSDRVQYDQFKEAQPVKGLPGGAMQAYKLKGAIDQSGHLIITEPIEIPAGDVEIIILQSTPVAESSTTSETEAATEVPESNRPSKIKSLQTWFDNTKPAPSDFDPDQARWEALKENTACESSARYQYHFRCCPRTPAFF